MQGKDAVTREQIEAWAKLAGIDHFTEKGLERLGDFAIFARAALATTEATDAIAPTEWAAFDEPSFPPPDVQYDARYGGEVIRYHSDEQIIRYAEDCVSAARAALSAPSPEAPAVDALTTGAVVKPFAWCIDPGAGSACDRFQTVEPYGWQYAEVEKRGGSITPLYAHPASEPKALTAEQRKRIAGIVHTDCTLIPGATFYNAAEMAIEATIAALLADRGSEQS